MNVQTYYVEATVTSTGAFMQDNGLTDDQVTYLRGAEERGVISGLVVRVDMDLAGVTKAFGARWHN